MHTLAAIRTVDASVEEVWNAIGDIGNVSGPSEGRSVGAHRRRPDQHPEELQACVEGMAGLSKGNFVAFAEQFDFWDCDLMTDVGGALGDLSRIVARREPHLSIITMDLPDVTELARSASRPTDSRTESMPSASTTPRTPSRTRTS
jgi:hypothetical protein